MPIGYKEEAGHPTPIAGVSQAYSYNGVAYVMLGDGTIVEMGSILTKRATYTHQVANNTNGGGTTLNAWNTLPLTTEHYKDTGFTIGISGTGTMTFGEAGLYHVRFWRAFRALTGALTFVRLRDITNSRTLCVTAPNGIIIAGSTLDFTVQGECIFKLSTALGNTVPSLLELQYYTTATQATNGLGVANGTGPAEENWLGEVAITKLKPLT